MNILYVMRYWPVYGGGETITVSLANEFIKRGHNVFIAYELEMKKDPMPYVIDSHIKEFKIKTYGAYTQNDVNSLRDIILGCDIDFMINQWGDTELCYKAKKDTSCKLITCWHLDVIRDPLIREDGFFSRIKKILYPIYKIRNRNWQMKKHLSNLNLSDKYVFLSESFRTDFLERVKKNIDANKTYAIANPLTYDIMFDENNILKKEKKVLFVGRMFEYHKRLSYILKIWQSIEDKKDFQDWELMMVGIGPDFESTKEMAEKMELKRVNFEGFQNPKDYYNKASVFVMTSAFEGFGMTLVEAQQYGVVPIAMDSYSSLHDIVSSEFNGVIVENNNISLFVNKLVQLMRDENYRYKLAKNAVSSCQKFSVKVIADDWEKLFSEMKNYD